MNFTENEKIGARIKLIRKKRGMTQEVLAEKAGICNSQQMSNIERGTAGLSVERLKNICVVLDVDADFILFGISGRNADNLIGKYIEKLNDKQKENLIEIIRLYTTSCTTEEM